MSTFAGIEPGVDILSFTDADIQDDWRKGLAQRAAQILVSSGALSDVDERHHFGKAQQYGLLSERVRRCVITSVHTIESATDTHYVEYSNGESYEVAGFTGTLVCEHGREMNTIYLTTISSLMDEISYIPNQ